MKMFSHALQTKSKLSSSWTPSMSKNAKISKGKLSKGKDKVAEMKKKLKKLKSQKFVIDTNKEEEDDQQEGHEESEAEMSN